VVIRLLDLGADKTPAYFPLQAARNPSLAPRGLRLLLEHPDVLRTQLRALLRVSVTHSIRLLLPMVGGLEEVAAFKALLSDVRRQLVAEGWRFEHALPIGAMIEIPSAALVARKLAQELDFLSLGTNDLVQYMLAADRDDETMARYYQPLHPAVLAVVRGVGDAARAAGKELSICGGMAGDPAYVELLLGLGLRSFSLAPGELLEVKSVIRRTSAEQAEALAGRALDCATVFDVAELIGVPQPAGPLASRHDD
jgi:phosphotransferase system enzyme I (PtsI)